MTKHGHSRPAYLCTWEQNDGGEIHYSFSPSKDRALDFDYAEAVSIVSTLSAMQSDNAISYAVI